MGKGEGKEKVYEKEEKAGTWIGLRKVRRTGTGIRVRQGNIGM